MLSSVKLTNMFPIEIWNHFNNNKRTNNDVEGYNSKLDKFLSTHPNIWKFINLMKAEESSSTLKYIHIEDGTLQTRGRNKIDVERDNKILALKCDYLSYKIDFMGYLEKLPECCSYVD